MQIAGKKILEILKSGTPEERTKIGDMLKDFFAPAFTSTPLKESNLEFYGHFVSGFFRTAVSSIVNSGVDPTLISSIDIIYIYYSHFRNHVKVNDPLFLPKAFHLLLLNITKTVDYVNYVDHAFKFATYLYNELHLINSEDNIDVFTNPAILWNFAGKLEKQPNFTDFILSLRVRHMSLRLLALKAKNLPSLVTKLGNTILRFRQQMSTSCPNKVHTTDLESAAVWNNIIETVLLAIAKEDKPKTFLLNILELHVHHARFISFYNISQSDSTKNFRRVRSFLDQHIEDDEYTESVFKLCDAILVIGDNSKKTVKTFIASMFDNVKDASTKLAAAVNKDTLTIGQVSLICDACGIFIESLSQYELLKEGKLKAGHLKVSAVLLEAHIKMLHSYYRLQQENTAENKVKASRQDVYLCMSYSILMKILYTLFETDDSNKWLLKSLAVVKNYMNDVQSLSETSAKTKEKQMVNISLMLRKFGRFCYNHGHNESGIAVYRLLLEQMKSQDLSEESNEQNYIKAHEYLAECQKRNGDWDGSFKTIISCILIASVSALSTAVKMWLHVKKEAVKDLPDVASKTLKTLIKENQSVIGVTKIDIAALLQLEWQSISSSNFFRKKQKDYAVALLTDLVNLSSDPFAKSRYLYELALILWNIPQPTSKSGKDYLSEAIHLIEPLLKSAQSKDKFLLGQAYLLLYTFEQEEFDQKNFQRAKFLGTSTEPQLEKVKPFTLQIEFAGMEKLDLSLELFEEAVAAPVGDEEKYSKMTATDIIALVNSIIFAASIYTASLKPLDAVRALTAAVEVCQSTESSELKLKVLCRICNLLSSLGYPTLAKFLMDTKLDIPQNSMETYSEKISLLVKTLTQAELFAEQGELKKSFELTQEVLCNCILTSSKNKSSCALLGWAKRLLSRLKLMPLHIGAVDSVKSNNEEETPLDLAYEAMRMYTAVIHCIVQPDTPSLSNSDFVGGVSFDFEKYEIVSELLKSLLYLSQLYCHVGEEREAKCYIKEGLRLAEIFVLPRWSAAFYLQSVRINFLSGKSLDIIKAKQESKLILLLSNKKEVEDSPCPQDVETVCTPESQTSKILVSKFKWSAECSDEESTMKADTVSDHTPLSKHAISKVVYSPAVMLDQPESLPHSELCLCQKCQDVLTLELQLKCKMISGEFDYAFGPRPFQENLQSDMEVLHLQFSRIIKANLEHTILNKVLHPLMKQTSNGFNVTTDQSIYVRNCCDLARIYLIRAQIFEQESQFQIAFNSAKKGLELLSNVNGYSNADLFFLRAGLTLSLANTISCVSDNINLEELLKTNFDLDCLSSQLSVISLKPNSQHSLCSVNNSETNVESCVDKIAALSIEDNPWKGRINEKVKKKQMAEAEITNVDPVTKTHSVKNANVQSPFLKQIQLYKERISVESRVDIQSNVKELSEEGTVALNAECGPKLKAKGARKTSRTSKTSRASNKVKETMPRGESEIEMGRECSRDDAGDDCKIGNFDKIIEREIVEEAGKKSVLEEKLETSERLDIIDDFVPLCKSLVNSVANEVTELKSGRVKSQASKRLKVSRNVKVTKTRSRGNTVSDKTDSKIAENILPPVLEEDKKSPLEKETNVAKKPSRSTNRKGKNCTSKTIPNSSPSPLANKHVKKKTSESKIFKSRKAVDSNASEENQNEEMNIYDFDGVDKELTVKKAAKGRRQPTAKTKPTGWQKRLADASNRIGREIKREADSPVEKNFSVSPVSLTPDFCLNKSWGCISLPDSDSPAPNISGCFSFEELQRVWEPFSEELLNVSSPELLRAAKGSNISDDSTTSRDKRATRRGPARALVSTVDKKGRQEKGKTRKDCQEECSDSFQRNMRFRCLESAYEQMRLFPPCSLYNFTCKALAMNYLAHDPNMAAFYLTEAQSVTLRHVLITQLSRKIRKIKDQNTSECQKKSHLSLQNAPSLENLMQAKQALSFGHNPSNINSLIEAIDPAWTVCQVSVVASPNFSSPPVLIVTQYRHNTSPTIVSLPGYSQSGGNAILTLYESIQLANRKSLSLLNKNEWWNARHTLNNKLQNVLSQMENYWLGCWKGILLGHLTNEDDRKKLKMSAEKIGDVIKEKCSKEPNLGLIEILIDSSECLSAEEQNLAISQVTGLDDVYCKDFISIKSQILQLCKSLNSSVSDRNPLIIILDKVVQHLPWENLPILRNRPVSRMPSLYYLKVQMSYLHHRNSVITDGFDPKSTFYVLNPDDNLPCTQEIFQKSFESTEGWEGVVSKPPTADQFISALTQKDTMIYCGHGNGNKYLHGDYLQQLNCRAVALLMGCSSGQMEAKGILDETGMINNYYLAFCPVIVANLWDVTDRDIDRFLQTLLNNWILSKDETKISLTEAVVKARSACKLPYLIGCAPVVYGIPL